jgi:hypothetical protein
MKNRAVYVAFFCVAVLCALSFAAGHVYEAGKVVKVKKQDSGSHSGGSDAPTQALVARYRVSIQICGQALPT